MTNSEWKNQGTTIAIFSKKKGEWEYSTFDNWEKAREAVNAARREGKAAVFHDGATPPEPPEIIR
ncbi:hypothetical protein ACQ4M3_08945 [Leptolyngbya sp. AN03gr2]|uniref:hypothetical protein n=1 Tax=unclassified Leptolyngbya TaxID=2650499 RepID=UPI003D323C17